MKIERESVSIKIARSIKFKLNMWPANKILDYTIN